MVEKTGKVYRIFSEIGNCGYIGCTTKHKVQYRINQHRYEFDRRRYYYSSFEVLKHPDWTYEVLEEDIKLPDIFRIEKEYMREYDNLVNICKNNK